MALQHKKSSDNQSVVTAANGNNNTSAVQLKDNRVPSAVEQKLTSTSSNPVQKKANNTGLPDNLKSGMENLSNKNLDHVKVHYNSSKPAAVQAHAYAQGSNIHLASGQEKHLPHELGHVVQQMEGRVKPTMKIGDTPVNDNPGLEHEATQMGQKAIQRASSPRSQKMTNSIQTEKPNQEYTAQFKGMDHLGIPGVNYAVMNQSDYGQWQQTTQAKFMSGVHYNGSQVVVTQFQNSEAVRQLFPSPSTITGSLIIAEGLLSLAASIAFFSLSGENSLMAGLMALGVAVSKIIRGVFTIMGGKDPSGKQQIVIDTLRGFEAGLALAVGIKTENNPGIVFGVAKSLRSLLQAVMDYLGKENPSTAYKISSGFAAALHWIEVAALAASGGIAVDNNNTVTGGLNIGVAASKTVRSGYQSKNAYAAIKTPAAPTENSSLLNPDTV
ncbi:DUF4157 domain-containing protein [Flavobacterium sp. Root901]|uniref:eCIS core domain-containing protein n=1 Tax=Flavobacterium sp. Root901 TaxID=1736605 RepID=UPI0009EAC290|nr:DUF4157 domain-containing protein [Flavobacterium sp. Root901]